VTPSSRAILTRASPTCLKFLREFGGRIPSAYILIKHKSAGFPTNEPIAPAVKEEKAFCKNVVYPVPFLFA
jgi:hypothetical protein